MIRYNPKSWFKLIFTMHNSDTLKKMGWILLVCVIYSGAIVYFEHQYKDYFKLISTTAIHGLLGFVMGLLLVFRTNSAYDRWWEGRKQWGAMVNNTRNLAIKLNAVLPEGHDARAYFKRMIPNYVFAMKEHLREGVDSTELEGSEAEIETWMSRDHVPNALASGMYDRLHELYKSDTITGDQLITLDKELKSFTDIIGACERIKNTPIPYSYSIFIKKFIFIYSFTMPVGLAFDFEYWTVPIVAFVLYVFGSLEILAEEIEDPFGRDANDLPTDDLSVKIKSNVGEILI